jgi:NADP-dependent 3-hydroxy acid dehydrogenase YdfG
MLFALLGKTKAKGEQGIVRRPSIYGILAAPNRASYRATKAAVAMLTGKQLAAGPLGSSV